MLPTLKNIREIVKEKIEFSASLSTLSKVLKGLGFSYKRCVQNRKVLMERPDVVAHRIRFFRQIKSYREEGRPIIYTNETYVHYSHAAFKCWQSKDIGLKVPFGKSFHLEILFNPHLPSEPIHPYQLDESISNFRGVWCIFSFLFYFL